MNEQPTVPDYGADVPEKMTPEQAFPKLNGMYADATASQRRIDELEQKLKDEKAVLRGIVEDALPKMMETCGVTTFTTADGITITVKEKIETAVPAPRREEAWTWLDKNGHADVIKREVTIAFGVSEKDKADACAKVLAQEHGRTVNVSRWVEPATLKSIIVAKLKAGASVPMDLFGVRRRNVAEFKEVKKS